MRILSILIAACLSIVSCIAQKKEGTMNNSKVLVAYFSATGTTAGKAKAIAGELGATLYEITSAEKYTDADLDWRDKQSRSTVEMHDEASRPALGGEKIDASQYDIIFIGFPNWWNQAPHIINSWIEAQNLNGKVVVPFSTSGGSGIENSVSKLRKLYPNIKWKEGRMLNGSDKQASEWAKSAVK